MRLHCDMCVQVVQCAISLFAAIPSTFVHPFNFLVTTAGTLMLLGTGNGDERVDLDRFNELSENREQFVVELTVVAGAVYGGM